MSPILGIWASQISGRLWEPQGAYDALATVSPNGSTGTIEFAAIPSTYKHLQIRYIGRSSITGIAGTTLRMRINGYTSTYPLHRLYGNGTSATAYGSTTEVYLQDVMSAATNSATASVFGAGIIDILDYANTNKNKTVRSLAGIDNNGSGDIIFGSGLYQQTTPISSITLEANGGNWITNSQFTLYGVK